MGINFDYSNFISSYRFQQIPKVDEANASGLNNKPEAAPAEASDPRGKASEVAEYAKAPKTANLEDISLTFNKQDDFGTIGRDADIAMLDMDKAVSDSKRSTILSGYQTFVGPTPEQMVAEYEDGLVIPK